VVGRLVAFDDRDGQVGAEVADGALEKRGLAGAGRADEVEGENGALVEPAAVGFGAATILLQHLPFEPHRRAGQAHVRMRVGVSLVVVMMRMGLVMCRVRTAAGGAHQATSID
jgi:hypothetical protein